ncbi:MAG: Stk1 family PASTA domain-containing Ser/Thr kinase [Oscillospiraceae bacterium]|nr:Stk1 family PASTA domain-containing Ser/Thr kinase [Oscillospiraceae bacterium]
MDVYDKYIGQVFDKRYKIMKIIGIGGMAVVFEAIDTVMRRTVALKMLKDDISGDVGSVKRFVNESKAVSQLSHPNIVSIYDVSVKEDHYKYIVMERVDGITLKSYITKKGVLSLKETISFTEQILRALEHSHSKGIIHRDIKPQNIMLLKNGRIKVTDFGIAKLPNTDTLTMTDKAIGTVFYISPEQASGKLIDPRSDLYSLGVVMYEMITGKLPFNSENPVSVALMQVNQQPRPPRELNSGIPIGLEQIILGAMEKNPDRRFQNANQMMRHIAQLKSNPNYVFTSRRPQNGAQNNGTQQNTQNNIMPVRRPRPQKPRSVNNNPQQKQQFQKNQQSQQIQKVGTNTNRNRRKTSTSMLPIISGIVVAFLLVLGISVALVFSQLISSTSNNQSASFPVESFVGEFYNDDFIQKLDRTKYNIVFVDPVYNENYPVNTIIEQTPKAGEMRKTSCDLGLTISMGAKIINLPNYTVMEYRTVEQLLRTDGLIPYSHEEYHDTILQGYVIRTDPEPGTPVTEGDTVTLYVSRGQRITLTTVSDYVGKTEAQAVQMLGQDKIRLGTVTRVASDKPKGTILEQSIPPSQQVPEKSTLIDFVVSAGTGS